MELINYFIDNYTVTFISLLIMLISLLMFIFPPKMNYGYGLKFKFLFYSQKIWDYGQRLSALLFVFSSLTSALLSLLLYSLIESRKFVTLINLFNLVFLISIALLATHYKLKMKFKNEYKKFKENDK